jgi:alpha-1,6-mannosyltransferase
MKSFRSHAASKNASFTTDGKFWIAWLALYAGAFVLLALPSLSVWFSNDFSITPHEFDFFIGQLDFGHPEQLDNPFSPGKTVHFFLFAAIGGLFWLLTATLYQKRPDIAPITLRTIAFFTFLAALTLPYISPDVFFYLGTGWLEGHYNLNPYRHCIAEVPGSDGLPMFNNIIEQFRHGLCCYGPVFQKIAGLFALLSNGSIRFGLILVKLNNVFIHLLNCVLIGKLAKSLHLNANRVVILFGLNPLILFSLVSCVHNDVYLLLCLLLAFICARDEKPWLAMIVLGLAVDLKYVLLLLVPFFILYFVRKQGWLKKILHGTGYFILFAGMIVLGHALYPQGLDNVFLVVGGGVNVYRNCIHIVLLPLMSMLQMPPFALKPFLNLAYVVVYGFIALHTALDPQPWNLSRLIKLCLTVLLLYLLIASEGIQEWYLCWLLPMGYLLENNNRYRAFTVAVSCLFLPLVIYTIKGLPLISFLANVCLYFLVLGISYVTLYRPQPSASTRTDSAIS